MYMHIIPLLKLYNLGKYTSHTIICLTVFTCAFCHMCVENLLKGPDKQIFIIAKGMIQFFGSNVERFEYLLNTFVLKSGTSNAET